MQLGLYANTHGLGYRDETNNLTRSVPAERLQPVAVAQDAEAAGFHSMWFPDHVCMPLQTASAHVANTTGRRSYEPHHEMLDAAVVMGAVAVSTSRIKLGTSVLIAPYRGPLNDARQLATVDVLSGGRMWLGVGAGWMQEEFVALGLDVAERGGRTLECIEIYKRCFTDEVVAFSGRYYDFADVSMNPKPLQSPRPPIIYGGVTDLGAKRAARHCDGYYPLFLDPGAEPQRYDAQQDLIRAELDRLGRPHDGFTMMAAVTMQLTDAEDPLARRARRPVCTGTPEQVLEDLATFAAHGYGLMVAKMVCPSGEVSELRERIIQAGELLVPALGAITPAGGWKPID